MAWTKLNGGHNCDPREMPKSFKLRDDSEVDANTFSGDPGRPWETVEHARSEQERKLPSL